MIGDDPLPGSHPHAATVLRLAGLQFDGLATEAERELLSALLEGDPESCELYLELATLESQLIFNHGATNADPTALSGLQNLLPSPAGRGVSWRRADSLWAISLVLLVGLSGLFAAWITPAAPPPIPDRLPMVVGIQQPARTNETGLLAVGSSLPRSRVHLAEGQLDVQLASGVTLRLQGPAEFSLRSDLVVQWFSGKLAVQVPKEAAGFAVEVGRSRIVDLGTEFSISCDQDRADVHVAQGSVMAYPPAKTDMPAVLMSKEATKRVNLLSGELSDIPYVPGRFLRFQSVDGEPLAIAGQIRWLAAPLPSVVKTETGLGETMYLFRERARIAIPAGITVSATEPGTYVGNSAADFFENLTATVNAAEEVDGYLIHYDPTHNSLSPGQRNSLMEQAQGHVTFNGEVIGILMGERVIEASHPWCAHPDIRYESSKAEGTRRFGYGLDHGLGGDEVTLSADRRSLSLKLTVTHGTDLIRVLVRRDR